MTVTEQPAAQRPVPTTLGERLRAAREARGLALETLADKTRVRVEHLRSMEAGRWLELPEPVYTRAYLTLVAKAVGLPAQQVLADYERVAPQPPKAPRRPVPWGPIIISTLAALLVLGGAGWYVLNALRERAVHRAQPPAATAVAAANAGQSGTVRLSVTSTPPGAVVYVDRVPLALKTPLGNYPVSAGPSREVRLILPGYEPYTTQLDLNGNRAVSVTLSPVGASTPPGPTVAPKTALPGAATGPAPAPSTPIPRVEAPATSPTTAPALAGAGAYTLNFSGRSWVHVTDSSGRTLFEGIPAQGASQSFVGPIKVRFGNPSAVKIFKNKVAQSTPGGSNPVDLTLP